MSVKVIKSRERTETEFVFMCVNAMFTELPENQDSKEMKSAVHLYLCKVSVTCNTSTTVLSVVSS